MIIGDALKGIGRALFGDKGFASGVVDVLKSTGVIKDPEQAEKALLALRDFELKKGDQEVRLEELEVSDRKSSRDMQTTALGQDDKFAKQFIYWYAIASTLIVFTYAFAVTFMDIPEANRQMASNVLWFLLGTVIGTIYTFFYGSSNGSLKKTEQLGQLFKK